MKKKLTSHILHLACRQAPYRSGTGQAGLTSEKGFTPLDILNYSVKRRDLTGFSLIELLVVMGVLGIIIGSAVFTLNPLEQLQKSRDAERKNDLAQIQRALETFYNDYGRYPENTSEYKIDEDTTAGVSEVNWGDSWAPYIATLPKDPTLGRRYVYSADSQTYSLYASLERGAKDSAVCKPGGAVCDNAPPTATFPCGSTTNEVCNYGVSSSNISP